MPPKQLSKLGFSRPRPNSRQSRGCPPHNHTLACADWTTCSSSEVSARWCASRTFSTLVWYASTSKQRRQHCSWHLCVTCMGECLPSKQIRATRTIVARIDQHASSFCDMNNTARTSGCLLCSGAGTWKSSRGPHCHGRPRREGCRSAGRAGGREMVSCAPQRHARPPGEPPWPCTRAHDTSVATMSEPKCFNSAQANRLHCTWPRAGCCGQRRAPRTTLAWTAAPAEWGSTPRVASGAAP
jgi:hypothetical protein